MSSSPVTYASSTNAAKYYGVTSQTVRRWGKAGKLACFVTPGGQYRYALIGRPEPVAIPKPVAKATLAAAERIVASVERAVAAKPVAVEPAPILEYIAKTEPPPPVRLSPAALRSQIDALSAGA